MGSPRRSQECREGCWAHQNCFQFHGLMAQPERRKLGWSCGWGGTGRQALLTWRHPPPCWLDMQAQQVAYQR